MQMHYVLEQFCGQIEERHLVVAGGLYVTVVGWGRPGAEEMEKRWCCVR